MHVMYVWHSGIPVAGNGVQRLTCLQGGCFANIVTLELRGNCLDTTDGINLPNLRHLYLVIKVLKSDYHQDSCWRWIFLHQPLYKCDDPEDRLPITVLPPCSGPKCYQISEGFRELRASLYPSSSRQPDRYSGRPQLQHEVSPIPQCQVQLEHRVKMLVPIINTVHQIRLYTPVYPIYFSFYDSPLEATPSQMRLLCKALGLCQKLCGLWSCLRILWWKQQTTGWVYWLSCQS